MICILHLMVFLVRCMIQHSKPTVKMIQFNALLKSQLKLADKYVQKWQSMQHKTISYRFVNQVIK